MNKLNVAISRNFIVRKMAYRLVFLDNKYFDMFADAEYVKKIIGRVVDKVLSENFIVYVEESRCTVQSINVQWDFVFL